MNKRSGIESKKRIIDAALGLFSEYGYSKASMRMIANAASISIGGLYLYFKNKDELYLTLIESRLDELADMTRKSLKDIDDPAEAVSKFISLHLAYAKRHRELILVQGREHGFAFGISVKRKFFKTQRGFIEGIIRKGIRSGVFKKCNVKETAKIIICTLRGFVLSLIVETDALFSPHEYSKLLLNGLLKKE
ncbi:MAG: TetR/AcrR family transcriptional regulator [Thermodesulfovibrionales bacterium]|nr:TetR/AcrR family transcriptional regulator [Thermodesulfovibrionales bacterium]